MYTYPSLIEAYDNPVKGWLVYIGLLADHRVNIGNIFRHNGLQAAEWVAGLADEEISNLVGEKIVIMPKMVFSMYTSISMI